MAVRPDYVDTQQSAQGGATPPAHAPHEVSQPLDAATIAAQLALAQANEIPLTPFMPQAAQAQAQQTAQQPPVGTAATPGVSAIDAVSRGVRRLPRPAPKPLLGPDGQPVPTATDISAGAVDPLPGAPGAPGTGTPAPAAPPVLPPILPHQKAASNTDSPSRGVPRGSLDPGKAITGGFGDAQQAQYFPLTGEEVREVVYALMDKLHGRLQDDLRFTRAMAYPRVQVTLSLTVDAYGLQQGIEIPVVAAPYDKTPIEVAEALAAQVVFVVRETHDEVGGAGADSAAGVAPNAVRRQLQMAVPGKRAIKLPTGGRLLVDTQE